MGPRNAVLGERNACGLRHGDLPRSAYEATKRCIGWGSRMRTAPRGPSAEPLWVQETLSGWGRRMRVAP
eukprot:9469186-Pyramimonas_sp.AAC.1